MMIRADPDPKHWFYRIISSQYYSKSRKCNTVWSVTDIQTAKKAQGHTVFMKWPNLRIRIPVFCIMRARRNCEDDSDKEKILEFLNYSAEITHSSRFSSMILPANEKNFPGKYPAILHTVVIYVPYPTYHTYKLSGNNYRYRTDPDPYPGNQKAMLLHTH